MVPSTYPINAVVRVQAEFREYNSDGSPGAFTDPASIVFKYANPDGTVTTVTYPTTIVRAGEGRYYLDITANRVGIWRTQVNGDGALQMSLFIVEPSVFP